MIHCNLVISVKTISNKVSFGGRGVDFQHIFYQGHSLTPVSSDSAFESFPQFTPYNGIRTSWKLSDSD